MLGYLKEKV